MLKVKLSRTGKKNQANFRIVVAEAKSKRDGKYVDLLGTYQPLLKNNKVKVDKKKYQGWLQKGAQPTQTVKKLVEK
jgi:small subunit ribosomal protein S16